MLKIKNKRNFDQWFQHCVSSVLPIEVSVVTKKVFLFSLLTFHFLVFNVFVTDYPIVCFDFWFRMCFIFFSDFYTKFVFKFSKNFRSFNYCIILTSINRLLESNEKKSFYRIRITDQKNRRIQTHLANLFFKILIDKWEASKKKLFMAEIDK